MLLVHAMGIEHRAKDLHGCFRPIFAIRFVMLPVNGILARRKEPAPGSGRAHQGPQVEHVVEDKR
jgi:hypothetical protein